LYIKPTDKKKQYLHYSSSHP